MNFSDSLPPHTEVVTCSLGCEGVGVDIDHWKIFWARFGQTHQRQIILMVGETKEDWDNLGSLDMTRSFYWCSGVLIVHLMLLSWGGGRDQELWAKQGPTRTRD